MVLIRPMTIDDYDEIFAMWQITTKRALSAAADQEPGEDQPFSPGVQALFLHPVSPVSLRCLAVQRTNSMLSSVIRAIRARDSIRMPDRRSSSPPP